MTITALKNYFFEALSAEYPKEEIGSFFNILSQEFFGKSRLEIALQPEWEVPAEGHQKMKAALEKLGHHVPLQYITGKTEFFGLEFKVNGNVLIPRPETEELVQWVLKDHNASEELRILDIGTGSGCIAISLAKNLPQAKVTAVDISEEALEVARGNAVRNSVEVEFLCLDILTAVDLPADFDIVVSNPPYVRELEKKEMQRNVLEHEPATALYVKDEDPLIFYRKITEFASRNLRPKCSLYFEINQYLGRETEAILQRKNFQTRLKKDIFGVHRMLRGIKS